ncbi:MAG: hypothetical protein ABI972_21435 [Acidobacteriota bacterium]
MLEAQENSDITIPGGRASYLLANLSDLLRPHGPSSRAALMARALAPMAAGLEGSSRAIARHMRELETGFLKFGSDTTDLTTFSQNLVDQCTSLLELSIGTGDTQEQVHRVVQLLAEPLEFLRTAGASTHERESELDACRQSIQTVLDADVRLSESVAPLRYIRTMFRTESARLDENIQAMFNALTEQMRELQERVEGAFESNYASLRTTQAALTGVSATLHERSLLLENSGAANGLTVTQSQDVLIESLRRNEGRTIQLTDVARGIESWVQGMVVAMQTQDIVNQKLQHVRKAIGCVEAVYQRLASASSGEAASLLVTLRQLARLEEAQLEGASADLRTSAGEFASACQQVLVKVEELDQRCLLLSEFDEITASANGMVEVLLESIDEVRRLSETEQHVVEGLLEKVQRMGELAAPLGKGITEVAEQMRRIALNTQIYAIQMGVGTGLEALSAESVLVAARVADVSVEVVASLEELNRMLAAVTQALESRLASAMRIAQSMSTDGAVMQSALHGTRDHILQLLIGIGDSMQQCKTLGVRIQTHISSDTMFSGGLFEARQALANLALACDHMVHYTGSAEALPDPELLSRNYTMSSERDVHNRILHGEGAEPERAESDLGDNIELF